jgi:hypothetical protein
MALSILGESAVGVTWMLDEPMARASHALRDGERVWLIDPTDDPPAIERVLSLGKPVAVLQLLDRHGRDCAAIAGRLGVPHLRVPAALPDSPFQVIRVVDNPVWHEVALWWPERRALIVPEAIGTSPMFAPGPAGAGVHIGLRLHPPRKLAAYSPAHLLVGHGQPLGGDRAAAGLNEALNRALRDVPRALFMLPKALVGAGRR